MKSHPLNPTFITRQTSEILKKLLIQENKVDFIIQNVSYQIFWENDLEKYEKYKFTKNILFNGVKNQQSQYIVFSIDRDHYLGSGSFSSVFQIDGYLKFNPTADQFRYESNDSYVIKIQPITYTDTTKETNTNLNFQNHFTRNLLEQFQSIGKYNKFISLKAVSIKTIQREYAFTKKANLKITPPRIMYDIDAPKHAGRQNNKTDKVVPQGYAFLCMERILGTMLCKILKEKAISHEASFLRVSLMLCLIQTYISEIFLNNIVHRDIKPDNIMVDIDLAAKKVKSCVIYDFNLSHDFADNEPPLGTLEYLAPEAFKKTTKTLNYKSDIFSLGQTIALLFNATYEPNTVANGVITKRGYVSHKTLFNGLTNINAEAKQTCLTLINGMTDEGLEKRLEPANILALALDCYYYQRAATLTRKDPKIEWTMHEICKQSLLFMLSFAKESIPVFLKNPKNLACLQTHIIQSVNLLDDNGFAYYLELIHSKFFNNIHTKERFVEQINSLIENLQVKIIQLTPEQHELITQEFSKRNCTIDNLVNLEFKMNKYLDKSASGERLVTHPHMYFNAPRNRSGSMPSIYHQSAPRFRSSP